jgi:MarR family transcriptional regulator, lower aerobic nicotinate degradation pathway regulator
MNVSTQSQACLPKELATSEVFLLGRLGYGLKRQATEQVEAAGFSLYDYSVMALLADGKCEAQVSIADVLQVDRSQLVGMLDGLEERGLIERRRDPGDRRRHRVTLTTAGERELAKLRATVKQIEEEFLTPLDAEGRETLYQLLSRLASHHDNRFPAPATIDAVAAAS